MKLFVSYAHREGFGNGTLILDADDPCLPIRAQSDVRHLQELIRQQPNIVDPIILWWQRLEED